MERKGSRWMTCLALLAIVAGGSGHSRAEVAAEPNALDCGVIVLGIIEGPDPIPQVIWEPIRDIDEHLFLNPDGALRGDGRPDIAIDPVTGWPHVVWAYKVGSDYDIAYSRWDGSCWTEVEYLSATAVAELDPRIYVDTSHVHVVWWEQPSGAIRLIRRPLSGDWEMPENVSGHVGMRPTVITWGGSVLVASETTGDLGNKDLLVSVRLDPSNFSTETVGTVSQDEPLNIVLHSTGDGHLWMDWRHSSTQFAYSVFGGASWGPPQTISWTSESWLEFEQARLLIRSELLSGP